MKIKKMILAAFLFVIFSIPVYAVDFIVGAKGGYLIWKPYFEDIGGFFAPIEEGSGVLYGPALSIVFTKDISLSIVGLTGTQSTYWNMDFEQDSSPDDVRAATYFWESRRYDIDTALSYRVLPYLKTFLGYKYQYISSTMRGTEVRVDSSNQLEEIYHQKYIIETMSNGPALGVGYSLLFGKGFFTTINVSGLYMHGYLKYKTDMRYDYYYSTSPSSFEPGTENSAEVNIRQAGTNLEPSIGFMPDGSSLIFTLGFRFQWLRTEFYDLSQKEKEDLGTNDMNDYLYGVFVSILYSF